MKAPEILNAALGHMNDRAATYDKPEGERSMGETVQAFKAVTGHGLTEEQGWLFMALLKAVRSQQGAYRADSYEDGAAYFALAGEAAYGNRGEPSVAELNQKAFDECVEKCAADDVMRDEFGQQNQVEWPADDTRIDVIGQNGNEGEHYSSVEQERAERWARAPEWANWLAGDCEGLNWFEDEPVRGSDGLYQWKNGATEYIEDYEGDEFLMRRP